jgi:cyclic beta-1,2-glucan synthetase
VVERLEATLESLNALERFRGHFYNWYDTKDFRPLEPRYVSSVDSGNLAGPLIALENACREMITRPIVSPEWLAGISDTLSLLREALAELSDDRRTQTVTRKQLEDALEVLAASLVAAPLAAGEVASRLAHVVPQAETAADIARTLSEERGDDAAAEVLYWAEALSSAVGAHQFDVEGLMPFASLLS